MNYPLKFKAAILDKVNSPLSIDEIVYEGPLKTGQVLTKIKYTGICGKQLEEIDGKSNFHGKPDPFIPHLLGHEATGVVMDIGPGVTKVVPGDSVVIHWMKGSGINSETPVYTRNGKRVNAGWITTFNEYGVISENRMTRIPFPDCTDLESACLLGCCVTTGIGVILNEAKPSPYDSVAVFGCGGVGLNAIQGAKLLNAYPIIAIDTNPGNLELADRLGADHLINPKKEDPVESVKHITRNLTPQQGAKFVICSLANTQAIEQAVQASAIPGKVYFVGVPELDSKIIISPYDIHAGRILLGSQGGGTYPDTDIPKYLNLEDKDLISVKDLVTKTLPFKDINKGIDLFRKGMSGRCVIEM